MVVVDMELVKWEEREALEVWVGGGGLGWCRVNGGYWGG